MYVCMYVCAGVVLTYLLLYGIPRCQLHRLCAFAYRKSKGKGGLEVHTSSSRAAGSTWQASLPCIEKGRGGESKVR